MGFCNCSMFCCDLLCVHPSFAIISVRKRELVALLCLPFWCLVIVVWLFLTMPRACLQFLIVALPDHTHYFFIVSKDIQFGRSRGWWGGERGQHFPLKIISGFII